MQEYYIRREGDEDASGPYDTDQITSLVEAGKLDTDAYFYDVDEEQWQKISSSETLMGIIAPKKKKLTLNMGGGVADGDESEEEEEEVGLPEDSSDSETEGTEEPTEDSSPTEEGESKRRKPRLKSKEKQDERPKVSVEAMLAQAEGKEDDDPHGKSPAQKQAIASFVGLRMATILIAFSALAMGFVELDLVKTANVPQMMKSPYVIIGVFDLALFLLLLLQVTEIYPVVRFRAAIGFGLLTVLFGASGDYMLLAANAAMMASLYFATAVVQLPKQIMVAVLGLLGIAIYAYDLLL